MLKAENMRYEKVMKALEELGLDSRERDIAEKYMEGEAGEKELEGITFRDMMQMPQEKPQAFDALIMSYYNKKRFEEAAKIFNLIFAVGGSTCIACFRYGYNFVTIVRNDQLKLDPVKVLAVYIQDLVNHDYRITASGLKVVLMVLDTDASPDPQIVLQACHEYRGQYADGQILLLTLYFYLRYGAEGPAAQGAELLDDRDKKILKAYEDILMEFLRVLFSSQCH